MGVEFQTHPIMNIKRNIIFALESRKKNGVPIVENVPIRMRVIFASQRIEFTTGYRIDVAKWSISFSNAIAFCSYLMLSFFRGYMTT